MGRRESRNEVTTSIDKRSKGKRSQVSSLSVRPMMGDSPNPRLPVRQKPCQKTPGDFSRRIPLDRIPEHIQSLRERFYREVLPAAIDRVLADQNRKRENLRPGTRHHNPQNERGDGNSLAGPSGQPLGGPGRNRGKKKNHSS